MSHDVNYAIFSNICGSINIGVLKNYIVPMKSEFIFLKKSLFPPLSEHLNDSWLETVDLKCNSFVYTKISMS